jgi:hypothetical protein
MYIVCKYRGFPLARQLTPERVIGRDGLIDQIWAKLESKSLRFTAERRVGKTTVMTKMLAEPRQGFQVVFMEVEAIDSSQRFAELLLNRLSPLMSRTAKAKEVWTTCWQKLGGTEIGGVIRLPDSKLDWRNTIEKTLESICTQFADETIVLLMDEVPYMLQGIAARNTSKDQRSEALALVELLRAIRQQQPKLRMVFAGSIGLHHVLDDLKQSQLASQPFNDMPLVEIRSLKGDDAVLLAKRLLIEDGVELDEKSMRAVCHRVVELTDAVPFYIESVCGRLSECGATISVHEVEEAVAIQLTNDHDPWEMEHFRSRLEIYYAGFAPGADGSQIPDDAIARTGLDHLAITDEPQSIGDLWALCKSRFPLNNKQHVIKLLRSLSLDHYLQSDTDKRYTFRFPLIKRWWIKAQDLES